ncbi:OPT oligopeptide transporter protein-domain-containing protein [Bisporella sp. PMI_857]|nr:OPT oligopeptide transporter protein-domain-containing protein [Bisporella sp. PMI_857]
MDKPLAGSESDQAREITRDVAMETAYTQETSLKKSDGVAVNEKTSENGHYQSDGSISDHTPQVYEVDNMERDDKGRLIVQTSELAITVLHVDDDPSLSPWTFRTFFIGLGLSAFGAVLATIYMFKPQGMSVSVIFLALASYVLGEAMSTLIPRKGILKWLNPFPFNQKEHVAILIMSGSAATAALCTEVIAAQKLYYPKQPSKAVSIFLVLASQLLGYGFAGILRKTLVYPKAMLWPSALPLATLFQTLHRDKKETKLRLNFFYWVAGGIFVWEWFPEYIMPILVGVQVFCLANRKSYVFTNLFGGAGGNEGLGFLSICFDWQYITSSCLYFPPVTLITAFIGYILCIFLFMGLYYSNILRAKNMPFLSQLLYRDNSSFTKYVRYNQTMILNDRSELDQTKLDEYGLPWFATTYASALLTQNLATTATLTYMVLWYWGDLAVIYKALTKDAFKKLMKPASWHWKFWDGKADRPDETDPEIDPHYKLMLKYEEVPTWWYMSVLVLSTTVGLICIYEADSTLPWYGYFIALILAFIFTLFMGIQKARFGMAVGQQNLIQMIGAFMVPGKPLANMYFTLFGSNSVTQALDLLQDLKIGQYMKLSPKATFTFQVLGTVVGGILNFALMESITDQRREILLSIEGTTIWSGRAIQSYNSQAIAWGALAKDLFISGHRYQWITYAFILGFIVPLPQYFIHKFYPSSGRVLQYINAPILCWYLGYLCVGINSSVTVYFVLAFITQFWVRKYHADWYMKYNYILSAGLDGGTQVCVFILSFAVFGSAGEEVPFPPYWGNNFGGSHVDYCATKPT